MVESVANLTLEDKEAPATHKEGGEKSGAGNEVGSKVNGEDTSGVAGAEVHKDAEKTEKVEASSSGNKVNENAEQKQEHTDPTKEEPKQDPLEVIKAEPVKERPIEESVASGATKESTKEEINNNEGKKEGSHKENGSNKGESSPRDHHKHNDHDSNGEKKDKDKKKKWSLFGWIKKEVYSNKKDKPSGDSRDKDTPDGSGHTEGGKDKDKENDQNEESREKKIIIVSNIDDFPEDCQKLIKQSGIPREKLEANFKILMNVLHFRTGKIFKTPETVNDPPRPILPKSTRLKKGEELITDAGEFKKLYKDMEELGKGGFGSVFQARSTKDKKKLVAIKRMAHKTKKHKAANFHEAAILSFINHPNIVKYFTCHEIKEELWVVMELMEGGTFEDAAKAWHFSEANIAYIARELLKGIAYLHSNQLAHRDLKSANIMMSVRGEVKIIDLGLCADMSVGFPTHMVGSPFWMPPEMIQCKPHNYAVDIWSFAISLLEIANQRPPMIESAVKAMFTVGTEGVTEMFLEEKKWSNEFKDFLRLCLKVDPEERATAPDLLNHSFIKKADSRANMENILRRIFLSNSLLNSGF